MSLMDSFINAMKIDDGDDSMYDEEDYLDDVDPVEENKAAGAAGTDDSHEKKTMSSRFSPARQQKKVTGSGMEVCVIKPTSVEDSREITETLLANRTVVLNMEGLDVDIAQRIIDFTSGSCYAINGNLQKISHYIFIITPASVDISGDFQEILSGSFLNN